MKVKLDENLPESLLPAIAALGHDVPEMPACPLVPRNITATVNTTRDGLAVEIVSADASIAGEVLRRARALITP